MKRFSLSVFLNVLVTTLVALHLLVASADEALHSFSPSDVHSEHDYSETQGSTTTESKKKVTEKNRFVSRASPRITTSRPTLLNREVSASLSDHIVCLSSVELRV
jgi:hypothetical protein